MLFIWGTDCEILENLSHWFTIIEIERVHAGFTDAYGVASCRPRLECWTHFGLKKMSTDVLEVHHRYLFAFTTMKIRLYRHHHADLDDQ